MIILKNLTLYRQEKLLFENANVQIQSGWKVGIIGKNGVGKSSLFALLKGELSEETGQIIKAPHFKMRCVEQEIHNPNENALQFVLKGDDELFQCLQAQKNANNADEIANIHENLMQLNAYSAQARALQILSGLGFGSDVEHKNLKDFSGGWQMRLNLARALFAPSDLLLLDEPTNHLDFAAIVWLENYLIQHAGTILMVAHDKNFLNKVCNHILSFENKHLHLQNGNYATYEKTLLMRLQTQASSEKKQAAKRAHLEDFIRRFRAKATKAKQAQSRIKMLEKLKEVERIHQELPFSFDFDPPSPCAHTLFQLENLHFAYAHHAIFNHVNLSIEYGERIGLLGKNGAGKSTFMQLLMGKLHATKGKIHRAKNTKIGYFAQHVLENLHPEKNAVEHFPQFSMQEARNFLARFAISGELALNKIHTFSGGEKVRLALALIAFEKPHILLLDEPTNHLDITMREALTLALQRFEGTIVLVSHDAYLLENVCDSFYLIERNITPFDGTLEDYAQFLSDNHKSNKPQNKNHYANIKKARAQFLEEKRAFTKTLNHIDLQLKNHQARLNFLHNEFLKPDFYQNEHAQNWQKEAHFLQNEIEHLENQWLTISENLENFEKEKNPRSTSKNF